MEKSKVINGYHIYIGGTWAEVTKNGKHIFDGSVEEDTTCEELYRIITKKIVFSYKGKELMSYDWLNEFVGERSNTISLLASEWKCSINDIKVDYRYCEA